MIFLGLKYFSLGSLLHILKEIMYRVDYTYDKLILSARNFL